MEQLKPCPFCGGEGGITSRDQDVEDSGTFSEIYDVACRSCGARPGGCFRGKFYRKGGEFFIVKDGYAEAVAAWNRREDGA